MFYPISNVGKLATEYKNECLKVCEHLNVFLQQMQDKAQAARVETTDDLQNGAWLK